MRKLALILLILKISFLAQVFGLAQDKSERANPPKSESLPRAFSRFSAGEVLKQIFDGYDASVGRVSTILNEDKKPALVRINEAKLWRAQGQEHLVVIVELSANDYQFNEGGLCGGCATYAILAVLKKEGDNLALVAKQTPRPSSVLPSDGALDDPYGPMLQTGHSGLYLDLAPYKLNARETLIGVRLEHMWIPALAHSTALQLYRIEGQRLREVFSELVVDRDYPDEQRGKGQTVVKTISKLAPVPSSKQYHDLVINKTTFRCSDKNDDWDCDFRDEAVRRIGSQRELWRFDGERYSQARKPNNGTQRTRNKQAFYL